MNLRRLKAVAKKEFLHVLRDPRSLMMGIGMPLMLLFLFGYALTLDVDRVPLAVWDQSQTVRPAHKYGQLPPHRAGHRRTRGIDRPGYSRKFCPQAHPGRGGCGAGNS